MAQARTTVIMAIKFDKVKPGMTLLDIHSERAGNTTMRRLGCWKVEIVDVDAEGATVRWNSNPPRWWHRRQIERLYTKPTKRYLAQKGGLL